MAPNGDKNSKDKGKHHRPKYFRIYGIVQESESGKGIPGLVVEAFDKDKGKPDDRLGSSITDGEGRFELSYKKKDFQSRYFERKPDLYLRVRRGDGEVIHTTEDKVRYEAGRTEAFILKISQSDLEGGLTPIIRSITVSPHLAKAEDAIEVTLVGAPGGRVRFSITNVFGATDVLMIESPENPGTYFGVYEVEIGDNVEDVAVTLVFTTGVGEVICQEAEQKVTIDTIPPRIIDAKSSRDIIKNGQTIRLTVTAEQDCLVQADISQLDTTKTSLNLKGTRIGTYKSSVKISKKNGAANGVKDIRIIASDPAGNESEAVFVKVELRNSELKAIHDLNDEVATKLNEVDVITLADLRRIDVSRIAADTRISKQKLRAYQGAAKLQAIGIDANIVEALVNVGNIFSPTQLALTSLEQMDEIIRSGTEAGIILREQANDPNLSHRLINAGIGVSNQFINSYWTESRRAENACDAECPEEFSVFGCHAYLLELVNISEMSWGELDNAFKQDFLAVTGEKTRRIDISIQVLERALKEDLGDPPRLANFWNEYDWILNQALVRVLVESTAKSETALAKDYPNAFNSSRPHVDRNTDLENISTTQQFKDDYNQELFSRLRKQTGKSESELKKVYLKAFDINIPLQNRNQSLEDILHLPSYDTKVEHVIEVLAPLKLKALIGQSLKTASWLRKNYYISFSVEDCGETTSCRQATLSLQEYLAKKAYTDAKYEYPTYDEWRVEQVKKFYPENVYAHSFKTSLISGNRQLLRQHLEQARTILDSVRVSEDGNKAPQEDDLLNSFGRREPYYVNFKTGLDLTQQCYEVDDLISKGHQAFFNEEYQLARRHYLQAADQIKLTSKLLSKSMGDALYPLWAPENKDSYFKREPNEFSRGATDFLTNTLLSYARENEPGVELGKGRVKLSGVDYEGTFKPLYGPQLNSSDYRSRLIDNGWKINDSWFIEGLSIFNNKPYYWIMPDGKLRQDVDDAKWAAGLLVYNHRDTWTDIAIEVETYLEIYETFDEDYPNDCIIAFRFSPKVFYTVELDTRDGGRQFVRVIRPGEVKWEDPTSKILNYQNNHYFKTKKFNFETGLYRMRVELRGNKLVTEFEIQKEDKSWDTISSFSEVTLPNFPKNGSIAIGSWRRGDIRTIKLWDLSPAKGAVADAAFFLPELPLFAHIHVMILLSYLSRSKTPEDIEKIGLFLDTLPTAISIPYDEKDWIIEHHVTGREPFDPLHEKTEKGIGLWYERGEDRLHRENLRQILNGLPMLFCHQYFFLLPVCLGDVAKELGQYEEALTWYRLVYDERQPSKKRGGYPYLNDKIEGEMMRLRIAQNYVEWADFHFNQNTRESVQQARIKYSLALKAMETEHCCTKVRQGSNMMRALGRDLLSEKGLSASAANTIYRTLSDLETKPGKNDNLNILVTEIQEIIASDETAETKEGIIARLLKEQIPAINPKLSLVSIVEQENTLPDRLTEIERQYPNVLDKIETNFRIHEALIPDTPLTSNLDAESFRPEALTVPSDSQLSEDFPIESASTDPITPVALSTYTVPFEIYNDILVQETYYAIGPLIGLPEKLIPKLPYWSSTIEVSQPLIIARLIPLWVMYAGCIPKNPMLDALTKRACLGIYHIDTCFNSLGFPQDNLSIFRFQSLISIAKNFAQMALAAEKDFIQYKEQFEKDTLDLMNASQAVAISQAGVRLVQLKVEEALNQITAANLGIERVNAEIALTQRRIDELGSGWSIFGIVFGAIVGVAGSLILPGASSGLISATISVGTGLANLAAGQEETEENLRLKLQLLKTVEYNAARQNLINAITAERSARQQARIAELEANFAAEKAEFLSTQFFNPQLWSFLAREIKKNYRTYLTYSTTAAWLAQRALEFERGLIPNRRFALSGPNTLGAGLNVVNYDYFQPSLQGLLGADNLLRDIATLENEKFLNEQCKKQITKVISLANTAPFVFVQFLKTGILSFSTSLDEFDRDYPGHYQRRIRNVRINLFGLVGQEGIKATLTCLGASQVVVKTFVEESGLLVPKFVEKTLRRPLESVALTNPHGGGIGPIPLVRNENILNPFEGMGVAAQWVFEMSTYANEIDFNTITDVQILIDYTALDDLDYRSEVIKRLPVTQSSIRPYSFCLQFSDACFHLKDSTRPIGMIETADGTIGPYTLVFHTRESDFPPNQKKCRLKEAVVYFHAREDSADYAKLNLFLSCKQRLDEQNLSERDLIRIEPIVPTNATLLPAETDHVAYDPKPHYLGKWQAKNFNIQAEVNVENTWYLHIPPSLNPTFVKKDENGQDVVVNGLKIFDFSGLQDVIFGLHYEYDLEKPLA